MIKVGCFSPGNKDLPNTLIKGIDKSWGISKV